MKHTMMPVDSFAEALFWGSIPAIGIMIGTLSGVYLPLTHGMIARAMSRGAGMLLVAAAVELAAEVLHSQPYSGVTALLVGAALFSLANGCPREAHNTESVVASVCLSPARQNVLIAAWQSRWEPPWMPCRKHWFLGWYCR